jgi:probable HAF family extracellular repeat protein
MTDLGALGGTRSTAMGINDKGQVVGWAQDAAGNMFPFLWNPDVANGATGQMINLGTFGIPTNREFDSIAMGINEAGQVVGKVVLLDATGSYWYTRGFVVTPRDVDGDGKLDWNHDANGDGKNDLMVDLGTLGYVSSNANAINDSGVIVGEAGSNLSMIWGHAARWTPQSGGWTITDLGGLHGRLHHSIAYDINNAGGIVGYSQEMVRTLWGSGGIAGYEAIGERRAYVHDGQIKAVDSLVAGMAGFTYLNEAKAISDNRFIVGEGKVGAARHAFVAVPIVSPLVSDRAGPGNAAELTMTQVESIAVEALTRWVARSGAKPDALLDIRIADLPGATLGLASGATIWLDIDAAGWGWFVDSTPWDDSEFTTPGDQGEQNRMDLVTVLTHEIGHVFGLDHEDDGVMAETLTAGTRQMPDDGLRDGELIAVWETLAHESGKRR